MRKTALISNFGIGIVVIILVVVLTVTTTRTGTGTTWQRPIPLNVQRTSSSDYRHLGTTGSVVYYRTTITEPTRPQMRLMVPETSSKNFAPLVVVFQPYAFTVGPVLPIEQPPNTLALAYNKTPPVTIENAFTQTRYTQRIHDDPEFLEPGDYTIAVYNAGRGAGQFRLDFDRDATTLCRWSDILTWPKQWWFDQTFAGFTWRTLIVPALLAFGFWAVYTWLDRRQLHPHKHYHQSQQTVKRKKKS